MVRENDEDNNNFLFKKYYYLIKKIASKYFLYAKEKGVEFEDLVQEGYIGFNGAISSFKENMDCTFYTFACLCVERQIKTFCKSIGVYKNEILNQALLADYDKVMENYPSFISIEDDFFTEEIFSYYKNLFSLKNSTVFELRYNGFSYQEISKLLDVSVNTVDSRLCRIRKILRNELKN